MDCGDPAQEVSWRNNICIWARDHFYNTFFIIHWANFLAGRFKDNLILTVMWLLVTCMQVTMKKANGAGKKNTVSEEKNPGQLVLTAKACVEERL